MDAISPPPAALATNTDTPDRPLPPGWRWVRLGEVCKLVGQSLDPQLYKGETFAHYSIPAYDAGPTPVVEPGTSILSNKLAFSRGTVLFSKLNPRIPRVWLVDDEQPYRRICSTEFLPLIVDASQIAPEYLAVVLQAPDLLSDLRAQVAAATKSRERLRPDIVLGATVPLPPLAEQRRIAALLRERMAAVEAARAAAETQLAAARALPAAELRAVFESDEAREWERVRLGDVAKVQSGYAFKSEWFSTQGVRLLRNANVHQGYIDWEQVVYLPEDRHPQFGSYELNRGDIVLSLDRPVVSNGLKVARLSDQDVPSLLLQRVGRFHLSDRVDGQYLYAFLNAPAFITAITQHDQSLGVPHVSPGQVEDVILPLPPLADQQRISAELDARMAQADTLRATLEAQLDTINALPAALLRQAFNGEL